MSDVYHPNQNAFQQGIDIYLDAMSEFVVRCMKKKRGVRLSDGIRNSLNPWQQGIFDDNMRDSDNDVKNSIDVGFIPVVVNRNWRDVFQSEFKRAQTARNNIDVITQYRNDMLGHHRRTRNDVESDKVETGLYLIGEVMESINRPDLSSRVYEIRKKLRLDEPPPSPQPESIARDAPPARVLVVAARRAWPMYKRFGVYRCQPMRSFRDSEYMAFYTDGEIKPLVAKIRLVIESLDVGNEEGLESLSERNKELIEELKKKIEGREQELEGTHKYMFLSEPDDNETVRLIKPITNDSKDKNGNLTPFTFGQRYVTLESLKNAGKTSDLETG